MIRLIHSCGDCAYLSDDLADFHRHRKRAWHRKVKAIGIVAAILSDDPRMPPRLQSGWLRDGLLAEADRMTGPSFIEAMVSG